jgi:hypothetical protein
MRSNGARSVRRNRRRSRRLSAAEARPARHQEVAARRKAWAVSPEAFAALQRGALDRRTPGRPKWMPHRDAIAISVLYGLGLRPQELFGATFRQASRSRFRVAQILTKGADAPGATKPVGRIIPAAKTAEGVRTMTMRPWLHQQLREWRAHPDRSRSAGRRRRLHHPRRRRRWPLHARAAAQLHSGHQGVRPHRRRARRADGVPQEDDALRAAARAYLATGSRGRGHQAHRRRLRDLDSDDPSALPARTGRAPRAAGGVQLRRRDSSGVASEGRRTGWLIHENTSRPPRPAPHMAAGTTWSWSTLGAFMARLSASLTDAACSTTAVWRPGARLISARRRCEFAGLLPS